MISKQALTSITPYAVAVSLFYTLTLLGWHLMPNGIWGLYSLTDGAWLAWLATSIQTWSAAFDLAPYNIMQGLGSLYPPDTPWLNPGALVLALPGEIWFRYYLSYSIYFLELIAATIVFGRSLNLSSVKSATLGFLVCFIIFPPYSRYLLTLPYVSLAPYYAHMLSISVLLFALFQRLGRASTNFNILIILGILAAFTSVVFSGPFKLLPFLAVYGFFGVALLTDEPTLKSLTWKVGTVAGALLLAIVLDFPQYYITTAKVSANDLFVPSSSPIDRIPALLLDSVRGWKTLEWCDPQVYLCSEYPIVYIHSVALAGVFAGMVFGRRLERRLAVAMSAFLLILYVWPVAVAAGLLGKLSRINAAYFHFAAYPFYAYFVVSLASQGVRPLADGLKWLSEFEFTQFLRRMSDRFGNINERLSNWVWLLVIPAVCVYVLCLIDTDSRLIDFRNAKQIPEPAIEQPIDNEITDTLVREIGLSPGSTFRGFATSYFGGAEGELRKRLGFAANDPFSPDIYYQSRFYLQGVYGSTFMSTELWQKDIPTSNDYGQWISKPYYVFTEEMFATKADQPALNELNPYRLNLKFLQAIGVRFLVTDAELHDLRLKLRAVVRRGAIERPLRPDFSVFLRSAPHVLDPPYVPINLYEISGSNIASYSPTVVHLAGSAAESFRILKAPSFDPSVDVVTNERIPETVLQPLVSSSLSVHRGHLRVTGRSAGTSLLLLPIQFSHCLSVQSRGQSPRLVRANLILTGIVFEQELEADLSFRFGPGKDTACRQKDVDDFERLNFSEWQTDFTKWKIK